MYPLTQSKNTTILSVLIALMLGCFGLSPQARAVCQEGCDTTTGSTFLGEDALVNNITGTSNTAIGGFALTSNTGGAANTAIGSAALLSNTGGSDNTATGVFALDANTTGNFNTAIGVGALGGNTIGSNNTAIGISAGNHITRDNNICIGNGGFASDSNTIRIGTEGTHTATYIAGIIGAPLVHGAAVAVGITPEGQLGVRASSVRFKELVKPMEKASEAIFALQPVTFRYKEDRAAVPQFGLVAEEVAKVNPDLVVPDVKGKPFTVRYDEVNAMLLNEFLKEHRKVQELEANATQQQKQIDALTAGLQKVNAQLETSKPAPQTVVRNR